MLCLSALSRQIFSTLSDCNSTPLHLSDTTRIICSMCSLLSLACQFVTYVRVDDAGFVSDHRLVLASIGIDIFRRNPPVVFSYRRIRDINTIDFERRLRN
jgi:hypothetical protein